MGSQLKAHCSRLIAALYKDVWSKYFKWFCLAVSSICRIFGDKKRVGHGNDEERTEAIGRGKV